MRLKSLSACGSKALKYSTTPVLFIMINTSFHLFRFTGFVTRRLWKALVIKRYLNDIYFLGAEILCLVFTKRDAVHYGLNISTLDSSIQTTLFQKSCG